MLNIEASFVLTDIEGTTTSISFVKDILFPYAKENVKEYLEQNWKSNETKTLVDDLIKLPEYKEYSAAVDNSVAHKNATPLNMANFVNFLIDKDLKLGPLKTLQGLIWAKGYENSCIKGHIYEDVPNAFKRWHDDHIPLAIYSSGSIAAQKLLFHNTEKGDLTPFLSNYFDTSSGNKHEMLSYINIANTLGINSKDILFLTDNLKEAEAATASGMQVVVLKRPGNAPLTIEDERSFETCSNFNDLHIKLKH